MFTKKSFKLTKKRKKKKKILARSWVKIGLQKKTAKCLIQRGEIPSPRQTSMDNTIDCVMKSERGALVRVSDPPSGHSVHNTTGDMWRASARRLIQNHSRSLSDGKKYNFFRVREKSVRRRGQPLAP